MRKINKTIHFLCNYSGLRFIFRMLHPATKEKQDDPTYRKPSALFIWLISLYIAVFGVSAARYERYVESLNMQISAFQTQMSTPFKAQACSNLKYIQENKIPMQPFFLDPFSTFKSFYTEESYKKGIETTYHTLYVYRKDLAQVQLNSTNLAKINLPNANLFKANLKAAQLNESNFSNSNFAWANLQQCILTKAKLHDSNLEHSTINRAQLDYTNLEEANLTNVTSWKTDFSHANAQGTIFIKANLVHSRFDNANLSETDFGGANLTQVSFTNSDLSYANLTNTNIISNQLSKSKTLYKAKLPPSIEKELRKTHPHLFEKPDWLED